jgi:hypothetical protein
VLRDAGAVGTSEHVDLLVAERGAHGVEVAHGKARRVELRAAAELLEAFARELAQLRGRGFAGCEHIVRNVAVEAVR